MLIAALLALLGSLIGVMVVSPLGAFMMSPGDEDASYEEETRQARLDFAIGQLVGVTGAVAWYAGLVVGGIAGVTAAALVWALVPASRALKNGFLMLVPAVAGGALAAAVAVALLG